MDAIYHLAIATLVFLGAHFFSSTPFRAPLVEAIGERAYLGAYSLASLATIAWMVWAYMRAPYVPFLQVPGLKLWPLAVMPVSLVLLAAGVMTPNPSAVGQATRLAGEEPARGILRVTRHPVMWAIALWAGVHMLARGDVAAMVFFGGFLLLALAGTKLIDMRKADNLGEAWTRFASVTSNVPFSAIVEGRNRFVFAEIGWKRVLAGLALFALLVAVHPWLFRSRPF